MITGSTWHESDLSELSEPQILSDLWTNQCKKGEKYLNAVSTYNFTYVSSTAVQLNKRSRNELPYLPYETWYIRRTVTKR